MRGWAILLFVAGCSGAEPGPSGGFSIDVASAEWHSRLGTLAPMAGRKFAVVKVSIANKSEPRAVSANGTLFSVATKGALSVPISGALAMVDSPCADLSVQKGGQLSCGLVFEVPSADVPATLVYDDKQGLQATSSIPAPVRVCDFPTSVTPACNTCFLSAYSKCVSVTGACSDGDFTCFTRDIQYSPSGLCGAPAVCTTSSACRDALNAQVDCFAAACAASCGG